MQSLNFEKLESKQLLAGDTYAEVLTSEDLFIFRGEDRPTPSEVTTNQWAYENPENGKITWYIYGIDLTGGGLQTLGKVKQLSVNFSEFESAGIGLYYTIYTAPQFGGGNAGSFYRSRINYQGDYSFLNPATDDVIIASAEVGETTPNTRETIDGVTIAEVGLNYEPENSVGPQKNTEIVSFIVISTSSGQPAGVEDWAISDARIRFRQDTYDYQFRTIGQDAPNVSDDPNWDVINTDLLEYTATIADNAPALLPPVEGASFILNTTFPVVESMQIWQSRTDTLVDPLTPPTTSNPQELLRLLQNRIIYEDDIVYTQTKEGYVGQTDLFTYLPWNELNPPDNPPPLTLSVNLADNLWYLL